MSTDDIRELVREYSNCACESPDPGLRLVSAALFVEECFGLALQDADLTEAALGSPEAIERFVAERMDS